ncbi:MAG: hypothetical protein MI919_24425, partial [Holophagales bacterium]|nr:hypothetical protein [Holophagales bacterium]
LLRPRRGHRSQTGAPPRDGVRGHPNPYELTQERSYFGPWVREIEGLGTGALVLDELGSARGRKSDIETSPRAGGGPW